MRQERRIVSKLRDEGNDVWAIARAVTPTPDATLNTPAPGDASSRVEFKSAKRDKTKIISTRNLASRVLDGVDEGQARSCSTFAARRHVTTMRA